MQTVKIYIEKERVGDKNRFEFSTEYKAIGRVYPNRSAVAGYSAKFIFYPATNTHLNNLFDAFMFVVDAIAEHFGILGIGVEFIGPGYETLTNVAEWKELVHIYGI